MELQLTILFANDNGEFEDLDIEVLYCPYNEVGTLLEPENYTQSERSKIADWLDENYSKVTTEYNKKFEAEMQSYFESLHD